jgi:hypothetical protein
MESTYNTALQCSTCGIVSVCSFDGDNYGTTAARSVEFDTDVNRAVPTADECNIVYKLTITDGAKF